MTSHEERQRIALEALTKQLYVQLVARDVDFENGAGGNGAVKWRLKKAMRNAELAAHLYYDMMETNNCKRRRERLDGDLKGDSE